MAESHITEFAAAKVNLSLRVLGRRPDGYHELQSLVAFADVGDRLHFQPGRQADVQVSGPYAGEIGDDNLIAAVLKLLERAGHTQAAGLFHLEKILPVAAGLGGGSADAAAAIRAIERAEPDVWQSLSAADFAYQIGADVPVCLHSKAAFMCGLGEHVTALTDFPPLHAVLANPGVQLPTRAVFAALRSGPVATNAPKTRLPSGFKTIGALIAFLQQAPNDLGAPACALEPAIAAVLKELRACKACRLARMSGSGPTCFAVFPTADDAATAVRHLQQSRPEWWVCQTILS